MLASPEEGRTLEAGRTLGHYRLLEKIGAGGMGEVWRARDERLERDVALKLLLPGLLADEAARKRFRREALALSKLSHPGIATVFDFDSDAGYDFLVMEYVGGATIGAHRGEGALSESEVVRLGLQLAEGLAAAHVEGIVHRDLKPANVRLTSDGRLKILDFGLAHLARPAGDGAGSAAPTQSASMTEAGALVGTLGYMAPEQVRGEKADARADLWAAGLVLYELATGRAAYSHAETAPLLHAILNESVALPRKANPRVSPALEAIILKCLEKEPARRYGTAKELAEDLQRLQGGLSVAAERSRTHTQRLRTLAVAGPVAVVLVLVALTAFNVGGVRTRLFAPPPIRSIAVLPLANLSGDPEQEYFADGMTEALINNLGQVSALRVISRTSAMAYKGAKKPLKQIARELGVDAIVEGSVARSGDRVKITAQLIRAKVERQLWADAFERDLKDVQVMQGEMAGTIAGAVKAKLTPEERKRLTGARRIDPKAYELYLRANYQLQKTTEEGWRRALEYMLQAVEADSGSAVLHVGLAVAYLTAGWSGHLPTSEAWPKARGAALKAISLDDGLAQAHAAYAGGLWMFEWDWGAADREYDRAIALDPADAEVRQFRSGYLVPVGRLAEAVDDARMALELDPVNPGALWQLAFCLYFDRRFDECIARCKEALDLNPGLPYLHMIMGWSYAQKRMYREACAEARKTLEALPEEQVALGGCGNVLGLSGRRDEALQCLNRLRKLSDKTHVDPINVAWVLDGLGETDSTVVWLERCYQERSPGTTMIRAGLWWTDGLRADPRYQDLVRRMNFPPLPKG